MNKDTAVGVVYQKNKKGNIEYAYKNKAYWDKNKQQSRSIRKLIGKVDPITNEIIPTRSYVKINTKEDKVSKKGRVPITQTKRLFYGATYLFDKIGEKINVTADLRTCFPDAYKKVLSIAYFLILEENNSLSRFSHWQRLHNHPYGEDIISQRSSEFFQSITDGARENFFTKQGKRRLEKEYWAFDTTSISSYSSTLKQVKRGFNKENDNLDQINLAMLFGEQSGLPFCYRKLPGNIPDVKIIKQLLHEFDVLGQKKVKVVMDRGFFSKGNVNDFYKNNQKFLIGTKLNTKLKTGKKHHQTIKEIIDEEKDNINIWPNLHQQFNIYGVSQTITWEYEQHSRKDILIKKGKRIYLLLFYNPEKTAKDQTNFNSKLTKFYDNLIDNPKKDYSGSEYIKYFTITETPTRGRKIIANVDAIKKTSRYFGYFALLSNEIKRPFDALSLYRSKDIIEKAFGNLKDRLNFRRLQVSSELALNGKIFVEFIALIYLSYIKKKMEEAGLFKKWTLQGLLDELDIIEMHQDPGHGYQIGEITKKQMEIYKALDIEFPSL